MKTLLWLITSYVFETTGKFIWINNVARIKCPCKNYFFKFLLLSIFGWKIWLMYNRLFQVGDLIRCFLSLLKLFSILSLAMFMKLKNVQYYCYDYGYGYSMVTLFRMGIFGGWTVWGGGVGGQKGPPPQNLSHISYNDKTYLKKI